MRASWRGGVLMLALVGCAALAFAAQVRLRGAAHDLARHDLVDATTSDETTGSLGPTGGRPMTQLLPLSEEERAHIHARVIRMPDAPTVDVPAPDLLNFE